MDVTPSRPDDAVPPPPPSGAQHELRHGTQRAVVVTVGGGVRSYCDGEHEVLDPYALDEVCPGAHGAPLVPWPNRLEDGRYAFDGAEHQLALTEPERHNAIHGLLRWRTWQAVRGTEAEVEMRLRQHPQPGYPFTVDHRLSYRLDGEGLTVMAVATNVGATACPYGFGQHPYLSSGGGPVDACELRLVAGRRIRTSAERKLPTGTEPVAGTPYDFRSPHRLGELRLDDAMTDLGRDASGRAWVELSRPDGTTAALWVDAGVPFVELFTGDSLPGALRRRGLGVEPMTCPPNALATGEHVRRLEPGASTSTSWGVRLRLPEAGPGSAGEAG